MNLRTVNITYKDGTVIRQQYGEKNIVYSSEKPINEVHLPYLGALMIGDAYSLDDKELLYLHNNITVIVEKLLKGKVNLHSIKTASTIEDFIGKEDELLGGEPT